MGATLIDPEYLSLQGYMALTSSLKRSSTLQTEQKPVKGKGQNGHCQSGLPLHQQGEGSLGQGEPTCL